MNPQALDPFGTALLVFVEGDTTAELIMHRDDGQRSTLPVGYFFRTPAEFTTIDHAAMVCCLGNVLDAGAGAGIHSSFLQQQGHRVTSIDISAHAAMIMKRRGLPDVRCENIFEFQDARFDTLLMLGHGVGIVESIDGLDRFLGHAHELLTEHGKLLVDSMDVRMTDKPADLAYHEANRRAGRYIGEIRMQFEFRGEIGPRCGWPHVDAETLKAHAEAAGWQCGIVHQEQDGEYLSRLESR